MMRGTVLGAFFGILPGAGPTIASFSAYTLEKKVSKNRAQFGKGAIEGVASPEAANNSASQCEFIPDAGAGRPGQRDDGADPRRAHDTGHRARVRRS